MTHTVSPIISDETLNRIITIESNGNPKAKARTSTATGLNQFVNGTWRKTVRAYRPDLEVGRTDKQLLDLRLDPSLSIELGARLAEDNARALGQGYTDGDLYLAHFLGIGDARKVKRAAGLTPVEQVVSRKAVDANRSILAGKSCDQVRAWADRKMMKARGADWVAKFYKGQAPIADPAADPAAAPVKVEPIDEPLSAEKDRPVISIDAVPFDKTVQTVQLRLRELGYYVTGEPDGKLSEATRDAILIFRRNNGLPLNDAIDEEFLARLATASKKPVSDKRATAQPKDLPDNKTLQATWMQKVGAFVLGIPAAIASFFSGILSKVGDANDYLAPIVSSARSAFGSIPIWVWGIGVVGTAAFMWVNARKAETDTVENYRKARLL